jgi:hypothetical protein
VSTLLTIAERDDESEKGHDFPEVLLDQIKRLREQLDEEELTEARAVWTQAGRPAAHPGQVVLRGRAPQSGTVPPSLRGKGCRSPGEVVVPQTKFKKVGLDGQHVPVSATELPPLLRMRAMPQGAVRG